MCYSPESVLSWGYMKTAGNTQTMLDKRFKEVNDAPAGFDFFVSLHNFVGFIEAAPSFAAFFAGAKRGSRAAEIPPKYSVMKQIYQGIEDINAPQNGDIGHDRYTAVRELSAIKKKDVSDSNGFWKRREALRKLAGEIHVTLSAHLSGPAAEK
jgi:hypothetical protein